MSFNAFSLMAKLSLDKSSYEKGLNDAKGDAEKGGSSIGKGLATVGKVGAQALAVATTAVTAFGASAIKTGMDFDSSMSQVGATMGFTVDELNDKTSEASKTMDTLRDFAQKMGSETAFSASQSADALNYMALAGYTAEQSMEMLPTVLNLASAGGIELAEASDMVTDAQSALGLSFEETAQMVDKMAKASSKSNTSVAQLGQAFLTVGGTAQNLAGGTTELATALGILADNGTKGAEGGTALRNIMLSLSAPTDKAREAMDALGISAYDDEGKMRPLQDVFKDLNESMADFSQEEKTNALNEMFNKVDLKSVNALLNTNIERWDELGGAIEDSAGSAEAMANVQLDNLSGDITLLKSAFEGFQIAVSEGGTETLRGFVQFAGSSLSSLTEAYKTDGVDGAMKAMGSIIEEGLKMLVEVIPKLAQTGMSMLTSIISGISSNVGLIALSATNIIMTLVNGIISNLPSLISSAIDIVASLGNGIAGALPDLVPKAVDMIITIVEGLIDNLDLVIDTAIKIIIALTEGLVKALPRLVQKAPEIIVKLVRALADNAPKLFEASLKMISMLWEGLKENLPVLLSKIPEMMAGIVSAYKDYASALIDIGSEWVEKLWEGIGNKVEWIKDKIMGFVGNIKEWFKNFFGGGGGEGDEKQAEAKKSSNLSRSSRPLIEEIDSAFYSASVNLSNSNSSNAIVKAINEMNNNMMDNMVEAISNGLTFEWDERTMGRMVRTYA